MPSDPRSAGDAELLSVIEQSFQRVAGEDEQIDANELQRALGLRSAYLAGRVFAAFDRDGDGVIDRREFVDAVRGLLRGEVREKLWFAFRVHDHDGDGFIDPSEMLRMICISMAESDIVERATQPASQLTRVLFNAADTDHDQRISFEEFVRALQTRPELLAKMTRSEAIWIAPNEDLLAWLEAGERARTSWRGRPLENGWAALLVLAAWVLGNAALLGFAVRVGAAGRGPEWMLLGRAFGLCLDFNGALVLIPMLRRLLTRLRSSALGRVLPLDEAVAFHRLLGHALFAFAFAHAACFVLAYAAGHADGTLRQLFFGTRVAATGLALIVVFAVMWVFSLAFVRRTRHFELFYFTHLLYAVWFALAIAHAPSFLFWSGVPLLGFLAEQLLRGVRRAKASRVVDNTALRSAVTKLEIERPRGFEFSPADYVFLRIPAIARHEWHPFTLSSAPERDTLTVHVRSLGNWSAALRRHAEAFPNAALSVYLDGPYGSPSAHIFDSRVAVLIGAGIGVTPFASVLESLVLRGNGASARPSRLEKAYFFWLNRDQYSFEWFAALLSDLERIDQRGLLEIHLCMTGGRAGVTALGLELARDVMHRSGRSDMITGLRTHTHVGPPAWEAMLGAIAQRHQREHVDVYFCGPPGLAKKLSTLCRGLSLRFREERF